MIIRMQCVVVGVVAYLLPYAHAQLGESTNVGGVQDDDTLTAFDSQEGDNIQDSAVSNDDQKEEDENDVVMKEENDDTLTIQEIYSKTVGDTYMGCLREDNYFNGSINYVNLSSVLEAHEELKTDAEACFQVCLIHYPFSWYLTLAPPLNGSVHACGCHYEGELDPENKVNEDDCEESPPTFYRYKVYCGPYNLDCYNGAGNVFMGTRNTAVTLLMSLFVVMRLHTLLLTH